MQVFKQLLVFSASGFVTALAYSSPNILHKYADYCTMSFGVMFLVSGIFVLKDFIKNRNNPNLEKLNVENASAVQKQLKEQRSQSAKDKLRRIASGLPD